MTEHTSHWLRSSHRIASLGITLHRGYLLRWLCELARLQVQPAILNQAQAGHASHSSRQKLPHSVPPLAALMTSVVALHLLAISFQSHSLN